MHGRRRPGGVGGEVLRVCGILSRALAWVGKGNRCTHTPHARDLSNASCRTWRLPIIWRAGSRGMTKDAEDVVQEAFLRAYKFFGNFHGGDSRAWLLTIVRHTCYTWLRQNRAHELTEEFDETLHDVVRADVNPETLLLHDAQQQLLRQALEALPVAFREVVIMRDLEGLSTIDNEI